jgi:hypothetical protein
MPDTQGGTRKLGRRLVERLRWRIVHVVDKLPGQCWTDLVVWALDGPVADSRLPWKPQTATCRSDAASNGRCYCNKIGATATPAKEDGND